MVTSIIACWLGSRRAEYYNNLIKIDKFYFLKNQLLFHNIFLKNKIDKILFVINLSPEDSPNELISFIKNFKSNIPFEVIFKDNKNFSYGAWEYGMTYEILNKTNSKYFLLLEDDYVPCNEKTCDYFLNKIKNNVGVVCSLYTNHAAISNCLVCKNAFITTKNLFNSGFLLNDGENYNSAEHNQINFLNNIKKNFNITDLAEDCCFPFYDVKSSEFLYYGNHQKETIITPLKFNLIEFNLIKTDENIYNNLKFLNETRNDYCELYLHDSKKYSLEETFEWFYTKKPKYYLINLFNKKLGYFRTSNSCEIDKKIMIGADINQNYSGNYVAYFSYINFINYLFFELNYEKIYLEVLCTNIKAINLYKKLGFKTENIKNKEVLKNNVYVDSIVMSLLKNNWDKFIDNNKIINKTFEGNLKNRRRRAHL